MPAGRRRIRCATGAPPRPLQVTQREIVRIIKFEQRPTPGKDIRTQLMPGKMPESEARKVFMLAVSRCRPLVIAIRPPPAGSRF